MWRALVVIMIVAYVASGVRSFGDEPAKGSLAWLEVEVPSSTIGDKAQVYIGDGDDLEAPEVFGFSGMSAIIMLKNHAYLAGEITSGDGKVLVVHCKFTNVSPAGQTFHPLDVRLSWSDNALVAAGTGSYPFAKDAAAWARLRKELTWTLAFRHPQTMVYVFGAPKDASVYQLTYEGIQIAEVHPKKR
jgi:hypothetical protein